jgi:hypothetical protein
LVTTLLSHTCLGLDGQALIGLGSDWQRLQLSHQVEQRIPETLLPDNGKKTKLLHCQSPTVSDRPFFSVIRVFYHVDRRGD